MAPDARRLGDRQLYGHLETYSRREVVLLAVSPLALGLSDPAGWSALLAYGVVTLLWAVVIGGWTAGGKEVPPTG